jgi:hypothetical protein
MLHMLGDLHAKRATIFGETGAATYSDLIVSHVISPPVT